MKSEVISLSEPGVTLTTYLLDSSPDLCTARTRPAVLICPGGAYRFCSDREAEPVAMAYLAEGYNAFVLRYSVGEAALFPQPLQDAEEALELLRRNAEAWGLCADRIAVLGFSAGGHLAASLATMGRVRPNALLLVYPCIHNVDCLPHPVPDTSAAVDASTPPTFLVSSFDDKTVPIANSLAFISACARAKIRCESHIFAEGTHGFSLGKALTANGRPELSRPELAAWPALSVRFLEDMGWRFA